jgi:hypothetical protein
MGYGMKHFPNIFDDRLICKKIDIDESWLSAK